MKLHTELPTADADWCVGEAPARWDVSFTDKLWVTLRRWFARDGASSGVSGVPTFRVSAPAAMNERERRQAA